eukprot:NODE_89_length_21810_cov_0.170098.p4 type:complete len:393 gc:universal NODE_89_length_21810_cov_0.170098:19838-21016(+)
MFSPTILTFFVGIYFLGALTLFSCRNSPHFKYRFPILVYLMSIHLLGKGVLDIIKLCNFEGFGELNCLELYWLNNVSTIPFHVLFPFVAFLFMILYKSHTNLTIPKYLCRALNIESERFLIQKFPWYIYFSIYIVSLLVPVLVYLVDLASGVLLDLNKTYPLHNSTLCTGPSNYSNFVIKGLSCIVDLFLFFKLKNYKDGLGIRNQLRIMVVIHPPLFVLSMIFISVFLDNNSTFSITALFSFLFELIQLLLLFYAPIYFHARFKYTLSKLKSHDQHTQVEMLQLLKHPSYRRLFYIYACKQFSSNYLQFLDKYEDVKKCKSNDVYNLKSQQLYNDFISNSACFYIKIPKELKIELLSYKILPKPVLESINTYVKDYAYDNLYLPFIRYREQ